MCVSISVRSDRDTCRGVSRGQVGVSKWRSIQMTRVRRQTRSLVGNHHRCALRRHHRRASASLASRAPICARDCVCVNRTFMPNVFCVARAAALSRPARKFSSAFYLGLSVQDVKKYFIIISVFLKLR